MSYKDAYYFPHDSNAKDDPKNVLLIEQLGLEGYGIYWVLIEILRDQPCYRYPLLLVPPLARKYNTTAEKMKTVILSYGLFEIDEDNFFSVALLRRMAVIDEKRAKAKMAVEIRWANKNKQQQLSSTANIQIPTSDTDVLPTHYDSNTRRGKRKERREEEKKEEMCKEGNNYGTLSNVILTDDQYQQISDLYENPKGLINKVSTIIANAKPKNDHFAYIIKIADDDHWPRKRKNSNIVEAQVIKGDMSPELRNMIDKYNLIKSM